MLEKIEERKKLVNKLREGECKLGIWPIVDDESSIKLPLPLPGPVIIPWTAHTLYLSMRSDGETHHAKIPLSKAREMLLYEPLVDVYVETHLLREMQVVMSRGDEGLLVHQLFMCPRTSEDAEYDDLESADLSCQGDPDPSLGE